MAHKTYSAMNFPAVSQDASVWLVNLATMEEIRQVLAGPYTYGIDDRLPHPNSLPTITDRLSQLFFGYPSY
jgi:hypothetical protein